jgi:hypothetical protein
MSYPVESNPRFENYAHPEALVSTQWVAENLGQPGLVLMECNEDILLYSTGHIDGAVKIDWHTELNHPDNRDYINGSGRALAARTPSFFMEIRATGGPLTRCGYSNYLATKISASWMVDVQSGSRKVAR